MKIKYNKTRWDHREAMDMIQDYLSNNLRNFTHIDNISDIDKDEGKWVQCWYYAKGCVVLFSPNFVKVSIVSSDAEECFQTLNLDEVSNELSHCYRD